MSETRLDSKRALEDETEEEEEEEEEEESSEEESEEDDIGGRMMISTEKIDIKFRNYTPRDKNLKEKIIRMESKTEEGTLLDADVPDVEPQKNRKNDILGFLPPVSNLDLKNIVRPKQRILDRRTERSITKLVQKEIAARQEAESDEEEEEEEEDEETEEEDST